MENREKDPIKIQDWITENGKWKIQFSNKITTGILIENRSGKSYIWKYENEELCFFGDKDIPKYVKNAIKSCISDYI